VGENVSLANRFGLRKQDKSGSLESGEDARHNQAKHKKNLLIPVVFVCSFLSPTSAIFWI
jgi:hypothetical protein